VLKLKLVNFSKNETTNICGLREYLILTPSQNIVGSSLCSFGLCNRASY
jgi:hypothetical protein